MLKLALIAVAGGAGALSRYGVGLGAQRLGADKFAFGTLCVNVLGCFFLALLMTVAGKATSSISETTRVVVGTGFLGAFTTFSTFGVETLTYLQSGRPKLAALNVVANLLLGLGAAYLGWTLATRA